MSHIQSGEGHFSDTEPEPYQSNHTVAFWSTFNLWLADLIQVCNIVLSSCLKSFLSRAEEERGFEGSEEPRCCCLHRCQMKLLAGSCCSTFSFPLFLCWAVGLHLRLETAFSSNGLCLIPWFSTWTMFMCWYGEFGLPSVRVCFVYSLILGVQ